MLETPQIIEHREVECKISYGGKHNQQDRHESAKCKIFVSNLHLLVTNDDLYDHFQQYGEIRHAYVIYHPDTGVSRGFGYIHYKDKSSVEIALNVEGSNLNKNYNVERFSLNVKRAGDKPVEKKSPAKFDNSNVKRRGIASPIKTDNNSIYNDNQWYNEQIQQNSYQFKGQSQYNNQWQNNYYQQNNNQQNNVNNYYIQNQIFIINTDSNSNDNYYQFQGNQPQHNIENFTYSPQGFGNTNANDTTQYNNYQYNGNVMIDSMQGKSNSGNKPDPVKKERTLFDNNVLGCFVKEEESKESESGFNIRNFGKLSFDSPKKSIAQKRFDDYACEMLDGLKFAM